MRTGSDRGIRSNVLLVGVCFLLAVAVRLPLFLESSGPLGGDEFDYYILGVRLATGLGYTYVPSRGCPTPVPRCSEGGQSLEVALQAEGLQRPAGRRVYRFFSRSFIEWVQRTIR